MEYFIPTEWYLSFYSYAFNDFKFDQNVYRNFSTSLINYQFNEVNKTKVELSNNYILQRPNDINFYNLSSNQITNLIINDLSSVLQNHKNINTSSKLELDNFMSLLKFNNVWNNITLNNFQVDFLYDILGINDTYSNLFYLYEYKDIIEQLSSDLFKTIENKFGKNFKDFLVELYSLSNTKNNIFKTTNVLGKNLEINQVYPISNYLNKDKEPSMVDREFIQDKLIRFNNNNVYVLLRDGITYSTNTLNEMSIFKNNSINTKEAWIQYLNNILISFPKTEELIDSINQYCNTNSIDNYQFTFTTNDLSKNTYSYFLESVQADYLNYQSLLVTITILVSFITMYWAHKKYVTMDYKFN